MGEPSLPLNKADREVIMLALSEWILFTHAIAFDPDEKGYTRQEITRMRNNIVKGKKLLARLREAPRPRMTARKPAEYDAEVDRDQACGHNSASRFL
jgi:hypothetical protein